MKTALLFLFLFKIVPVAAQYCCTEVGKVLYYTTVDKKEEKTLRDCKRLLNYILCIRFISKMHSIVSASQFSYTNLSQGCF